MEGVIINKKKIMLVFGTRPEAIKMAPLVLGLKAKSDIFEIQICLTGQHRDMLDQVLQVFGIIPDIDLNVMQNGQDLFDVTTKILSGMKNVFNQNRPDVVLVHGDTTTALAAAIAAFYAKVPIGHIEAGLRTYNIYSPFPEEFNRQVITKATRWHFAPTNLSRTHLLSEGVNEKSITVTGNTVIDAMHLTLSCIENDIERLSILSEKLNQILKFNWKADRFILITGHRRENFGDGFSQICEALRHLALHFNKVMFVYPVHLNPNVQAPVRSLLANLSNVVLIEPLNYELFIYLLKHCYFVLTDSGGIQEEAPSLGKPVLVMRDITERPEAFDMGTVELVGSNKSSIIAGVTRLLKDEECYLKMSQAYNPYGDGKACERIIDVLEKEIN